MASTASHACRHARSGAPPEIRRGRRRHDCRHATRCRHDLCHFVRARPQASVPPINPPSSTLHCGSARWMSGPATAPQASASDAVTGARLARQDEQEVQRSDEHQSLAHERRQRIGERVAGGGGDDAASPVGERESDEPRQALRMRQLGAAAHAGRPSGHRQQVHRGTDPPVGSARRAQHGQQRDRHRQEARRGERYREHDHERRRSRRSTFPASTSWPGSAKMVIVDRSAAHSGNCRCRWRARRTRDSRRRAPSRARRWIRASPPQKAARASDSGGVDGAERVPAEACDARRRVRS